MYIYHKSNSINGIKFKIIFYGFPFNGKMSLHMQVQIISVCLRDQEMKMKSGMKVGKIYFCWLCNMYHP